MMMRRTCWLTLLVVALTGCSGPSGPDGGDAADGSLPDGMGMSEGGSADVACAATLCGTACVDLQTDPNHCGACDMRCPTIPNSVATCTGGTCGLTCTMGWHMCGSACVSDMSVMTCGTSCTPCTAPANATPTCDGMACGFRCNTGYTAVGTACVAIPAPRPLAPLSGAIVTSRRPTLRWALAGMMPDVRVEICRDRACGVVVASIDVTGTSAAPTTDLPAGVLYWRLRSRVDGMLGAGVSPTWQFYVGTRTAGDTSYGSVLDLNGDGFTDVVVGAYNTNAAAGRAFVYYGWAEGTPATASANLAPMDGLGGSFGFTVASAGDVNGDGFVDLAVAAPSAMSETGRVYIYFGGEFGVPATPSVTLTGVGGTQGFFGRAITSAGDVNDDGYGDLLIGAPGVGGNAGRAYVYLGSAAGPMAMPADTLNGPGAAGSIFGVSVASVGDADGNGRPELVVGATGVNSGEGRAYVYAVTSAGVPATPTVTLNGATGADTFFGRSVAAAGDVNGDGRPDLLVGAPDAVGGDGRVFLYLSTASGIPPTTTVTRDGPSGSGGSFGYAIAGAGDVNGDGFADVVVGGPNTNADISGRAYLFTGSMAGLGAAPLVQVNGPGGMDGLFGVAVQGAGDINRDGFWDVIVGAEGVTNDTGAAYVFYGAMAGIPTMPSRTLAGPAASARFGSSVAGVQ
jgi:hypothetical protein